MRNAKTCTGKIDWTFRVLRFEQISVKMFVRQFLVVLLLIAPKQKKRITDLV
jgi:hypothetical protein